MKDIERERLIQGISLVRGLDRKEARERAEFISKITNKANEINEWIQKNMEYGGEEPTRILLISAVLSIHDKEKRDKLIRLLYQVTIREHEELMENARKMKEMGELKRA